MWQQLYILWKSRCDYHHGTDQQTKREQALLRLQPQVEQLYEAIPQLELQDRRIFSKSSDDLLLLPISNIENWIFKAKPLVKAGIIRARITASKIPPNTPHV
jgi:hypothetical protein